MESIRQEIDDIIVRIQEYPAKITLVSLEEQGNIIIELDELKEILKGGLTCINRILDVTSAHLCRSMANTLEDITYRHRKATITATARGFFKIEDPETFLKEIDGDLKLLMELMSSKRKSREFFEEYLRKGQKLPKGVKEFMKATVQIRRKN